MRTPGICDPKYGDSNSHGQAPHIELERCPYRSTGGTVLPTWFPIPFLLILPTIYVRRRWLIPRKRRRLNLCIRCGYSLRVPEPVKCPECMVASECDSPSNHARYKSRIQFFTRNPMHVIQVMKTPQELLDVAFPVLIYNKIFSAVHNYFDNFLTTQLHVFSSPSIPLFTVATSPLYLVASRWPGICLCMNIVSNL